MVWSIPMAHGDQERLRAVVKEVSESRRRVILVVDEVRDKSSQRI